MRAARQACSGRRKREKKKAKKKGSKRFTNGGRKIASSLIFACPMLYCSWLLKEEIKIRGWA